MSFSVKKGIKKRGSDERKEDNRRFKSEKHENFKSLRLDKSLTSLMATGFSGFSYLWNLSYFVGRFYHPTTIVATKTFYQSFLQTFLRFLNKITVSSMHQIIIYTSLMKLELNA